MSSIHFPTGWKELPPVALVELALEETARFKFVAAELDRREPDATPAKLLVEAYGAGTAEPWFTAHLLGCIGHELGYDTVRAILLAAPLSLAESYAGSALAKIRGSGAHDDLVHLTVESPARRSREGAAYGLARLGTGEAATAIMNAAVSGAIGYQMGGVLIDLPVGAERIGELLDGEERSRRVAIEYLTGLIQRAASEGLGSQEAAERLAANREPCLPAIDVVHRDLSGFRWLRLPVARAGDRVRAAVLDHQDDREVGAQARRQARPEEAAVARGEGVGGIAQPGQRRRHLRVRQPLARRVGALRGCGDRRRRGRALPRHVGDLLERAPERGRCAHRGADVLLLEREPVDTETDRSEMDSVRPDDGEAPPAIALVRAVKLPSASSRSLSEDAR